MRVSGHDGEGIIGDAPKPREQDLGPLFAGSLPVRRCGLCGREFRTGEAFELHPTLGGICLSPCQPKAIDGRDVLDSPGPVDAESLTIIRDNADGSADVWLPKTDDVPIDPRKPEPPTNVERLEAIERVKAEVLPHLLARARFRRDDDDARAGVTADDVWEIARGFAPSAIVGTSPKSWSWTGPWLASVARTGALAPFLVGGYPVTRRSKLRDESHGNAQRVYLDPTDRRAS